MTKKKKIVLISLAVSLFLIVAFVAYVAWSSAHTEIQVRDIKRSPDGKWTAVVQLEAYTEAFVVNDAVYAVRLKGPAQKDRQGDLVMNVPVNYPDPEPSIDWSGGRLVVRLADHQKYQYLANPVSGVPISVQEK
jgi:hypothetical protein